MAGVCKFTPPFVAAKKLPGVIGEPSGLKNMRCGPSDDASSTSELVVNAFGNTTGAGEEATQIHLAVAA
jgi:hypothetical protein